MMAMIWLDSTIQGPFKKGGQAPSLLYMIYVYIYFYIDLSGIITGKIHLSWVQYLIVAGDGCALSRDYEEFICFMATKKCHL